MAVTTGVAGAVAPASEPSTGRGAIEAIVQRRLADAGVSAGAIVIVRNGKMEYSGG